MEYEVRLTAQAVEQVRQTMTYISHTLLEPGIARRWSDYLEREIRSLKQHPARYPLTPEEPWHTYGVRKMIVKNFFVYYLIEEDKRQVAYTNLLTSGRLLLRLSYMAGVTKSLHYGK